MLPKCKTSHISYSAGLLQYRIWDDGILDPGRLQHACSQDTDLSCHLPISISIALCNHNPSTLQTADRQTDVMLVAQERHAILCSSTSR